MRELIKFELIKIFKNKGIYIAALGVFILTVGISMVKFMIYKDSIGTREDVKQIAENYISDNYSKKRP